MKKLLINLRYLLAPTMIAGTLAGVLAGNGWEWVGVALLGLGIIVDTLVTAKTKGAGFDEDGNTNAAAWFQNAVMYGMFGLFVLLQLALGLQVSEFMAGNITVLQNAKAN